MTRALFWIPLLVCTCMALTPDAPAVVGNVSDVILHGLAFTYLTFTLWLAHFAPVGAGGRAAAAVALWMLGYGISLELAQSFVPKRTPEVKDVFVDGVGIGLGLGAFWAFSALRRRLFPA